MTQNRPQRRRARTVFIATLAAIAAACVSCNETTVTTVEGVLDITSELPEGNPQRGQERMERRGLDGLGCVGCHIGSRPVGPNFAAYEALPAIGERAAIRIAAEDYTGAATTPEQYLLESIVQPKASVIEGVFLEDMPEDYSQRLTTQELADLIAYLLTFK